jgi:UDP-N-acetylmuramoyl-tripeptide--D-alanyl-D-alanine ligase
VTVWTLDRIGAALAGSRDDSAGAFPSGTSPLGRISTDTRALGAGDVFVALRGERFDGHDFLAEAVSRGASALIVDAPDRTTGLGRPVFTVSDTTAALGALASLYRRLWGGPLVAVAGSNGKTTTKEMIRFALHGALDVYATTGNLNNQVGVPLTLLEIPPSADVAVVEIGTNHPGEVALLRHMAQPDVAVVTSIGEEHLEGLGDLAGVLREEASVYCGVEVAIAPANQPEVGAAARAVAHQTVEVGLDSGDLHPLRWGVDSDGFGWAEFDDARVVVPIRGTHNLRNAMIAIAVARACGVSMDVATGGIARVQPLAMRGATEQFGALTIINDAYNANPASMREAIVLLDAMPGIRQRVLVLGSMRELGARSAHLHGEIAGRALKSRADVVAAIGDFVPALLERAAGDPRVVAAPDVEELWPQLRDRLTDDAVVLLKASRGVRLERLMPYLREWGARRGAHPMTGGAA